MWMVSCVSYRWDSLYQRVSIAALAGRLLPIRFFVGKNSLVAYRRHCSHCRYRRANLRSLLPSMVNFLTSDHLNMTNIMFSTTLRPGEGILIIIPGCAAQKDHICSEKSLHNLGPIFYKNPSTCNGFVSPLSQNLEKRNRSHKQNH